MDDKACCKATAEEAHCTLLQVLQVLLLLLLVSAHDTAHPPVAD